MKRKIAGNFAVQDPNTKDTLISMLIGIAAGLTASLLCLYGAALLISKGIVGEGLTSLAASLCCALGSFVSGFLCARSIRKKILLTGFFTGALFLILLIILGALFFSGILPEGGFIPVCVSCFIGAILGSIVSSII